MNEESEASSEVAEAIEATVQEAIDDAAKRVEAAEETAEAIALAAIEGERAERVRQIEEGLSECRMMQTTQAETLSAMTAGLQSHQAEMTGRLSSLEDAVAGLREQVTAILTPPQTPPPSSISAEAPPIAEAPPMTPPPEPVADELPPPRKRLRLV